MDERREAECTASSIDPQEAASSKEGNLHGVCCVRVCSDEKADWRGRRLMQRRQMNERAEMRYKCLL
ncbi:unnamed protein product [Anisakis simplex]|uniref:Uncharacterized protein n=1 Tax=Anisakis simplex TaxID=6269 RepID=A0A0M3K874_ANISI|nr:unnamed protein product [Anisakis simplex]